MENSENMTDNRIYEVSFLILPTFLDEEVSSTVLKIKDIISTQGGNFLFEENPKKIPLAYTMIKKINNKNERFDDAYFGWLKFELDPIRLEHIEHEIKRLEPVIRFLIIKTTKENTFIPRRFQTRKTPMVAVKGEAVELDEVALEKELDAMVAEEA